MTSQPETRLGDLPISQSDALDRLSLIGQDITASLEFADIFAAVERHVGALLDAATFYIGVIDERLEWIDIPLFVDGGRRSAGRRLAVADPVRPASLCVRENREILREKTLDEAIRTDIPGTAPTLTALFRPLVVQGRMIGVMSVQSARPHAYGARERTIFRSLCAYVAVALANAASFRRLAAIEALEVLGQVGQEVTASLDVEDILSSAARHAGELFGGAELRIGLLAPDGRRIVFRLAVAGGTRIAAADVPLDEPLSDEARAIRDAREILGPANRVPPRPPPGHTRPETVLARPLAARDRPLGVASLRSADPEAFSERQVLIFRTFCSYISIALANARAFREADAARAAATTALRELRIAQDGLIHAEKMASLGRLVAGIAHEVNTPVGTALTLASTFLRVTEEFRTKADAGQLRRSDLGEFVERGVDVARQLTANLSRASDLVGRFKQVAADRTSDEQRCFVLADLTGAVLTSLSAELRRSGHAVEVSVPREIELDTYPGALSQVLTNLIVNGLTHAYPSGRTGWLRLDATRVGAGAVRIVVADGGVGIAEQDRARVFEPFYRASRGPGGPGLGLHIAYNLVTETLEGRLTCVSSPEAGAAFCLEIPTRILGLPLVRQSPPQA